MEDIEMLNENVKAVLKKATWNIATCGEDGPNVVPVGFKDLLGPFYRLAGEQQHGKNLLFQLHRIQFKLIPGIPQSNHFPDRTLKVHQKVPQ